MADFISGKNTVFKVQWNNQIQLVPVKSWGVEEVVDEIADGVNGEQRDRLQTVTKYFKAHFECYEDGATQILQNFIASQANDDSFNPAFPLNAGILFNYQDGSKAAFTLANGARGPMKMESAGRVERFMHSVTARFQYFSQVQAA